MSSIRTNNRKYPANKWASDRTQSYPINVLDQLIDTNEAEIAVLEHNLAMHKKRIEDLKAFKTKKVQDLKRAFDKISKEHQDENDGVLVSPTGKYITNGILRMYK